MAMRAAPRMTTRMNHQPTLVIPETTAGQPPTRWTVKISSADADQRDDDVGEFRPKHAGRCYVVMPVRVEESCSI